MKNNKKTFTLVPLLLTLLISFGLLYKFGERWLHLLLLYLSQADWARQIVSSLPMAKRVANRFVAGEDLDSAMATAQQLNNDGLLVTLDFLGESVSSQADAIAATNEILRLLDRIEATAVDANVSVKLSQLGLKVDPQLALDNMRQILTRAKQYNNKIRIDMEESAVTDQTLNIYRTLRDLDGFGHRVGIVIQSYLYRSEEDVQKLINEGAWVRLCKGAYAEPAEVAFPDKKHVDVNYVKLTQMMLDDPARANGVYLGVATHDEKMIQATLDFVTSNYIAPESFEFQMLYGIRRELQDRLVEKGYRMRVYVPYGTAWYPYFVRRLAERPANLWFFISNFIKS